MLTKCPECGSTVSDRAAACPHCGAPLGGVVTTQRTSKPAKVAQAVGTIIMMVAAYYFVEGAFFAPPSSSQPVVAFIAGIAGLAVTTLGYLHAWWENE